MKHYVRSYPFSVSHKTNQGTRRWHGNLRCDSVSNSQVLITKHAELPLTI